MRDTHRLREKFELSLDNRQIVSITVAALVVLGGVFVLGVVVGKKLAGEQFAATPPADLLTSLDQKTAALETVQKDASLTFQDELTRKSPSIETPKAPEPRRPEEKVVVAPPAKAEEKPAAGSKEDLKAELARAEAEKAEKARLKAEAEAAKEPARVEVARAEKPVKPEPVKVPEAVKEEPVATRTRDGGSLKEAFGKVQKLPLETSPDGNWTLQLSAYQDKAEADRFAAGLRDKGYAPFIVEAKLSGKGTWYRVRMGRFGTKDAASRYLSDFKRETSMDAIVTGN